MTSLVGRGKEGESYCSLGPEEWDEKMLVGRILESLVQGISLYLTRRMPDGIEPEGVSVLISSGASVFPAINVAGMLSN